MSARVFIAGKGLFLSTVSGSGFVVARRYNRVNPELRPVYELIGKKTTRKEAVKLAKATDKKSAAKIVILPLKETDECT